MVGDEVGAALLGEIPQNLLREAAHAGGDPAREAVGDVVAREHELVDPGEQLRLVAGDPCQLRGGEVARRVERMGEAEIAAESLQRLGADRHGPRIAPDDRFAERMPRSVEADQPVHLVGDADRADLAHRVAFGGDAADALADVAPPHFGVLFGPSRLGGVDGHLLRRIGR